MYMLYYKVKGTDKETKKQEALPSGKGQQKSAKKESASKKKEKSNKVHMFWIIIL